MSGFLWSVWQVLFPAVLVLSLIVALAIVLWAAAVIALPLWFNLCRSLSRRRRTTNACRWHAGLKVYRKDDADAE